MITGGLGPTQDDLTKETVAEFMGEKLVLHQPSLDKMKEYFAAIGREMTPNNEKQAMLPQNAVVLPNDCGTAPGCIIEKDGKTAILLPGPPVEMETMYANYVRPYLLERADSTIRSRTLRLFGIGESKAESMIRDLMEQSQNPTVAPYAKDGNLAVDVRVSYPDIAAMTQQAGILAEQLLQQRVDQAESVSEVYDGQGYRQEILDEVLLQAVETAAERVTQTRERNVVLELTYEAGNWWVVPGNELRDLLSGALDEG